MNPIEQRIGEPSDDAVYESAKFAHPNKSDEEIIAELMRNLVIVAVCYNDVVEGGRDPYEVFRRYIFEECDELAGYFPWPPE